MHNSFTFHRHDSIVVIVFFFACALMHFGAQPANTGRPSGDSMSSAQAVRAQEYAGLEETGLIPFSPDARAADRPSRISIFDMKGQRIRSVSIGEHDPPVEAIWDGFDDHGRARPAEIYVLRRDAPLTNGTADGNECFPVSDVWEKSAENPVLPTGSDGEWDDQEVSRASVVAVGDTLKMWYSGFDGTMDGPTRIGHARSVDGGETWVKYDGNPVFIEGETGQWDDEGVDGACVLRDGGLYRMWYIGHDENVTGHYRIGLATSTDGVHWERHGGNPVLGPGPPGTFDDDQVLWPSVVKEDDLYHMYYVGMTWAPWGFAIGHAVSSDGTSWERGDEPVLSHGGPGEFDEFLVNSMAVLPDGGRFNMWYSGSDGETLRIGFASSPDGLVWTKDDERNPVLDLGSPGAWDDLNVHQPLVLKVPGFLKMWYSGGCEATYADRIGLATRLWTDVPGLSLKAAGVREGILLEWRSSFDGATLFIIERSPDGKSYHRVHEAVGPERFGTYLDDDVEEGEILWYRVTAVISGDAVASETVRVTSGDGSGDGGSGDGRDGEGGFLAISPNPMNPVTRITYVVERGGAVSLTIYNMKGERVRGLVDRKRFPGIYSVWWRGVDDRDRAVTAGVYYCVLDSGSGRGVKKILLLK